MGIYNLRDERSSVKDTAVDAVFEVDCTDCEGFGLPRNTKSWTAWVGDTTIYDATMKASGMRGRVTVHLYDKDTCREHHPWLTWIHPELPDKPFNPGDALKKDLIAPY